jgi:hypothetical protein
VKFKFDPDDGDDVPDDGDEFSKETPTDTSITVTITDTKWNVDIGDNKVYVDYFITGTTSGVDHCEIVSVSYYDDGSFDDDVDWMEDFDQDGFTYGGMKFELYHFKPTSENWKTWEYAVKGEMTKQEYNETSGDDDGKEPSKIKVYVRAYSDPEGNNWNQASKSVSMSSSSEDDDDDDGAPGFESVIFIAAIAITLVFVAIRRRRL